MKVVKIISRIISVIIVAVLLLLLVGNILNIIATKSDKPGKYTVFGISYSVVISGSMSGTIEINDMIVARKQPEYNVGDIITFTTGSSRVTHRIVGETEEGFITKGDANNTEDKDIVTQEDIIGKVIFTIPRIGAVMEFMQTPLGMLCLVLLCFVVLLAPSFFGSDNESGSGRSRHEKKKKQVYTPKKGPQ